MKLLEAKDQLVHELINKVRLICEILTTDFL